MILPVDQQVDRDDDDGQDHQRQEHLDGLGLPDILRTAPEEGQEQMPKWMPAASMAKVRTTSAAGLA